MTPYKIMTLFEIHKEFNPNKFKQTRKTQDYYDDFDDDMDDIDRALGGF